jgi:hypothetical protein
MLAKASGWLDNHWLGSGIVLLGALSIMLPVLAVRLSGAELTVIASVVLYLIHQMEEHTGDAFRTYINTALGHGKVVLTPRDVMVINVGLVWILFGACLVASTFLSPDFALVPVYLMLVNAAVHIVAAAVKRQYNPGLGTALALFLPFGAGALWASGPFRLAHGLALLAAILVHAAIALPVRLRIARAG